ncbi:hypothetical protein TNIN_489571 [Trichonephila inaurata madagascariensis]|uniref:Uncharacterized protein n=1 Tax=Trichonephila inaurata madagascariensis TaxID=2747483 RepID=A0A8X6YKX4_9ARAC|nr:hypothetical protein TNIN_489571 [Trichonephila inaurata madagascariensis]
MCFTNPQAVHNSLYIPHMPWNVSRQERSLLLHENHNEQVPSVLSHKWTHLRTPYEQCNSKVKQCKPRCCSTTETCNLDGITAPTARHVNNGIQIILPDGHILSNTLSQCS